MKSSEIQFGDLVWPHNIIAKPHEKSAALTFDFSLDANQTKSKVFTVSTGFDFVASIINAFSGGAFKIQIRDEAQYQDLFLSSNGERPRGSLVTGNGTSPFILPKLHRFEAGTAIEITVQDISGVANEVQVVLAGYKDTLTKEALVRMQRTGQRTTKAAATNALKRGQNIRMDGDLFRVDRFITVVADFVIDGDVQQYKYPVSTGSNFMWEVFNVESAQQSDGAYRDVFIQIRDEMLNEDFFTSPARASIVSGNGQSSFILPKPYMFQGGGNILFTVQDTDAAPASPADVQLAMVGYKVVRI